MPKRLQRRRTKGWRMPPGSVYVGRPTKWGNPFQLRQRLFIEIEQPQRIPVGRIRIVDVETAVAMYRIYIEQGIRYGHFDLRELRGNDLLCWCPLDKPCHADVLLELANR